MWVRGDKSPEFGVGDANANCPLQTYRYKRSILWPSKYAKIRFLPGLCPGPHWRAHNVPPVSLVGWGGDTTPHTAPHSAPTYLRHSPCVPQNSSQIYAYGDGHRWVAQLSIDMRGFFLKITWLDKFADSRPTFLIQCGTFSCGRNGRRLHCHRHHPRSVTSRQ